VIHAAVDAGGSGGLESKTQTDLPGEGAIRLTNDFPAAREEDGPA